MTDKAKPVVTATSRTVVVANKIPTGIQLQLQEKVKRHVDTKAGLEVVEFWVKRGKTYHCHGPAYPALPPDGYPEKPIIVGGYAMSQGIPTEFWNEWLKQNQQADYVKGDMVRAFDSLESATAWARENAKRLSGLEPMSREVDKTGRLIDPRVPRPINMGITKLGPDTATAS
jgi:hypothetical protein